MTAAGAWPLLPRTLVCVVLAAASTMPLGAFATLAMGLVVQRSDGLVLGSVGVAFGAAFLGLTTGLFGAVFVGHSVVVLIGALCFLVCSVTVPAGGSPGPWVPVEAAAVPWAWSCHGGL